MEHNIDEKEMGHANHSEVSDHGISNLEETAHEAAERGRAATDKYNHSSFYLEFILILPRYGHSLVQFDPAAEARLRWKIDLYIVPTVSLLYLFCFIDRANIGQPCLPAFDF